MIWSTDEWDAFVALLEASWPGDFDENAARAYRVMLDDVAPAESVAAMRRLLHSGRRFRPSVAELLAEIHSDPSLPTFSETYQLIYGPAGVLAARPERPLSGPERYASEADRRAAFNAAASARASDTHPLVSSFVARYGLDRLRALNVEDPVWGHKVQADLENAWDAHLQVTEMRTVHALTTGEGLRKLDPLAALGIARPKEIGA